MQKSGGQKRRVSLAGMRLERTASVALHQQIAAQLRDGILRGVFPAGTQFLGTREVARELGCSRTVVLSAWDILYAEGYLESMPRGGVSVAEVNRSPVGPPADPMDASRIAGPISKRWQSLIGFQYDTNWESDFSPGAPDISSFPFADWARLLRQTSQHPERQECLDLSPAGLPELRREIANFLGAVRGLVCTPEQIVITSGTSSALDLCSRMILDHGDEVWVEEPGFVEAQWSLTAAGAKLVPVPVDDKGLCVAEGITRAPNAKLIVVTPSHQYPLGVSMGLERRLELLDWANRNDVWIVEDDYNSEFRHQDSMIASLKSLDREQRVIYLGTFSKIMMPSLRLGYIVAPERFVDIFTKGRARIDVHSSGIGQRALAEFMREGHLLRHLRRMRKIYAERQQALMDAIRTYLPDDLTVAPCATGLHLVALFTERLKARMSDVEAARRLKEADLHVQPLAQNHLEKPIYAGLVFGYGRLKPADAPRLIAKMAAILGVEPPKTKK